MKFQGPTPNVHKGFKLEIPISSWTRRSRLPWNLGVDDWNFLARGLALFLGGFCILNLLGNVRTPNFDANLWWIDLRWLPVWLTDSLLVLTSVSLVAFGLRPPHSAWRRQLISVCAVMIAIASLANIVGYYALLARHGVTAGIPIPFSLFVTLSAVLVLGAALRRPMHNSNSGLLPSLAVSAACILVFPFAQMFCFGKTDYRRPADVAVVLGARVYADGRPSDALADRVRTGCQLYRDGLAKKLLFSGGPGDGAIHETEAMKRLALQLGVKPQDILVDEGGLNTRATVRNSEAIFKQLHASRVLVVSHFYHLPRIKLAYQRDGWEVYTVPAKESYILRQLPYNMAREVAALWVYYLRPLA